MRGENVNLVREGKTEKNVREGCGDDDVMEEKRSKVKMEGKEL